MEKRYQVFISSTYEDLQEERKEVIQALLELDCIPAGMELFPATNDDQWTTIKKVIDDCDYYIVIIGGRYGSTNKDGISYTEMEYKYALENNKPIIGFIHASPETIPAKFTEQNAQGKAKLEEFLKLVKAKLCRTWSSPSNLGSVVSRSMVRMIKDNPAIGWVKAENIPTGDEILKLKNEIDELKNELSGATVKTPDNLDLLSKEDDKIEINFTYHIREKDDFIFDGKSVSANFSTTWNTIFYFISPSMINEIGERWLKDKINEFIKDSNCEKLERQNKKECTRFEIKQNDFDTIKIQFKALGMIAEKKKAQRSVKDRQTYWTLTPYGDAIMTNMRAIKK